MTPVGIGSELPVYPDLSNSALVVKIPCWGRSQRSLGEYYQAQCPLAPAHCHAKRVSVQSVCVPSRHEFPHRHVRLVLDKHTDG